MPPCRRQNGGNPLRGSRPKARENQSAAGAGLAVLAAAHHSRHLSAGACGARIVDVCRRHESLRLSTPVPRPPRLAGPAGLTLSDQSSSRSTSAGVRAVAVSRRESAAPDFAPRALGLAGRTTKTRDNGRCPPPQRGEGGGVGGGGSGADPAADTRRGVILALVATGRSRDKHRRWVHVRPG